MIEDGRIRAWVALSLVDGLGSRDLHALLTAFDSPEAVLAASPASLSKHVSARIAAEIRAGAAGGMEAERVLAWAATPGNHLLTWDDADYPKPLLDIGDAPALLYYKGRRELLNAPALAIIGSRNASPSGIRTAEEFATALAVAGLTIVSGLALGIDAAAHRGGLSAGAGSDSRGIVKANGSASADGASHADDSALATGSTIAIVGTGIDRIYPAANGALAHQIAERGGIISEFRLGTPPRKENFPRRNRLISGMSQGVLVVEAALGSGSLITARLAGEQGREIFAIPGSIHSPFSKGCHKLIREGAKLVESARDVLEELNLAPRLADQRGSGGTVMPRRRATLPASGPATELLAALGYDPVDADMLTSRLAWPVERVMTHLLELEMSGTIAPMPGGRYQRLR
jgi:DNA processing protein